MKIDRLFFALLRRLPVLEATAQEISAATGNAVLPLQCDVRDPAAIKAAVDSCVEKFGLPDVVVHNAAGNFVRTVSKDNSDKTRIPSADCLKQYHNF